MLNKFEVPIKVVVETPILRKHQFSLEEDPGDFISYKLTVKKNVTPICLICGRPGLIFSYVEEDKVGIFCSPQCEAATFSGDFRKEDLQKPRWRLAFSWRTIAWLNLLGLTLASVFYLLGL